MDKLEKQQEKLANEHEVYEKAIEQANELVKKARQTSCEMHLSAVNYKDEILSKTETMFSFDKQTENIGNHYRNSVSQSKRIKVRKWLI